MDIKFRGRIKNYNGNPYVDITATQAKKLKPDWRKPLPVRMRINNRPEKVWRINLMPKGDGSFYLYLHGYVRKASNTKVGDLVEVKVAFDKKYKSGPLHPMPPWFRIPLSKNKKAKQNWQALTPSRKKEILGYFSWLKSKEAKKRNVAKALEALSGKKSRFMARDWNNGH